MKTYIDELIDSISNIPGVTTSGELEAIEATQTALRAEYERVQQELATVRGAMAADDERLRTEGERSGVEHWGCDTAHWMADEILGLRQKLDGMTSERDTQRELLGRSAEAIYGEYHDMRQGLAAITKDRNEWLDTALKQEELYLSVCNELYELKERSGICTWTASDDDEYWHTDCGEDFTLETGSPKDNGMRYCNFCGKQLVERINENESLHSTIR